jgi:hypothetical protein
MSMDPNNPYSSPSAGSGIQPAVAVLPPPRTSVDYMRMITYVFENPNWFMNLLLAALCSLIPVIGKIVVTGYAYEATIMLITEGGSRYPDFNFNRFGDYLMRGLWPFLVSLVFGLVVAVAAGIVFACAGIVGAIAGEDAGKVVSGLMVLALFLVSPGIALVLLPMLFRSALTLDFMQGFQVEWVKDFISKVWIETILGVLFLYVASMVLSMIGFIACCVGIFLVGPVLSLAFANLLFQIYSIYVTRSGTPIPIKMSGQPMMAPPI